MIFAVEDISGWWGFVAVVISAVITPIITLVVLYYQERIRQIRARFDREMEQQKGEVQEQKVKVQEEKNKAQEGESAHKQTLDTIREKTGEAQEVSAIEKLKLMEELKQLRERLKDSEEGNHHE